MTDDKQNEVDSLLLLPIEAERLSRLCLLQFTTFRYRYSDFYEGFMAIRGSFTVKGWWIGI